MNNALLASFDRRPALVAQDMQSVFESCLHQASAILERLDAEKSAAANDDGFWLSADDWRSIYRPYVVKDGILQIPVKGVLLHDLPWQFGSWATGYVYIRRALERGLADGNVRGIALVCDTPGGHVAGCFDLGDQIFASRSVKPIRGFAAESAYSAGYLVISSAGRVSVARTGGVGSIGVVTAHLDVSSAMEKAGVKLTFIHFGKHKVDGNAYEALPEDVRDRIQARIDEIGEVFVATVARNRGMDAKAVRDTEALTFTASQAVSNGLADDIGSLDDAVAAFAAELSTDEEDETMTGQKDSAVDQAAIDTARADGLARGKSEGATEERARITAIISSDVGKVRPKAALSAALKTEMTVEQATAFLADLPEEKVEAPAEEKKDLKTEAARDFQKVMDQSDNPNLGQPGGQDDDPSMSRAERALMRAKGPKKAA